jgi:hypothetical protein
MGAGAMWKRVSMIALLGVLVSAVATPVAANGARVDRLENIETVLAVAMPVDFPIASLMRADCSSLVRVERPDGSATEIMDCQLNANPVRIPEFQGVPPSRAFVNAGAACLWFSDYWFYSAGIDVLAESFHYTVTPSGHVHVVSEYPAEPLACE